MFGSLGVPELLIILAIVLLIFGYSRLPQLGKGLGTTVRRKGGTTIVVGRDCRESSTPPVAHSVSSAPRRRRAG